MKKMLIIKILIIVTMFLFGCAGTSSKKGLSYKERSQIPQEEERGEETRKEKKEIILTYLDTINEGKELVLNDNDFDQSSQSITSIPDQGSSTTVVENIFRIQVLASSKIETVRKVKKELENKIPDQISIGYEAPYYKLYVGSFSKKVEAKNLLIKLKNMGYTDAWIVTSSRSNVEN